MPLLTSSMPNEQRTLIDALLDEQRDLTAVGSFSRWHETGTTSTVARYQRLIPLSAPEPGEQYAFEVDLDKCSGCKSCVTACHALNGLEENEAWRRTGLLRSDDWRHPFQQTVTTACHHCVDPACLNGCPVLAYEKDPHTGIVRHLDDQCIGCQYCVLKCPYEVPQYSHRLGIVRKCDLCSQRLANTEAPACVQACPNEAIRITLVDRNAVRERFRNPISRLEPALENGFLHATPPPQITLPTTQFVSARALPARLLPADASEIRLQPMHGPLVWMLVCTQFSVGLFAMLLALPASLRTGVSLVAVCVGLLGLAGSVLHLGRPLKAWRAFLGLRRSWLSREIVVFGGFMPVAATAAASLVAGLASEVSNLLVGSAVIVGLLGVFCSAMVYHDTGRVFWRGAQSIGRFFVTALVLGLAGASVATAAGEGTPGWIAALLAVGSVAKLALEHRVYALAWSDQAETTWPTSTDFEEWSLAQTALLMRDRLGLLARGRFMAGILGGAALPLVGLLLQGRSLSLALVAGMLVLVGEFAERVMFFRTVVPPRMPGGG